MFTLPKALDPYRWWAALAAAVVLAGAVYAVYDWAYDRGYDARDEEQKTANAAQAVKNATYDISRMREGAYAARKLEHAQEINQRKSDYEKARRRANPPVFADGMCQPASNPGVSTVPSAGSCAHAFARVSDENDDLRRIATNNADQVTALQADIERSRRGYNKVTGQQDERPVTDAEQRWAKRLKELEELANSILSKS